MEEARNSAVIERLKAREAQRTAELEKRHQEIQDAGVTSESAAAFLDDFGRQKAALEADIQAYAADGAATDQANDLASRSASLEQSVAAAAYFLPPYDLRNASLAVAALKGQLDAAMKAQQPRKKFSFSKKTTTAARAEPNSSSSAATEGQTNSNSAAVQPPCVPSSGRTISGLQGGFITLTTEDLSPSEDVTLSDLQGCTIQLLSPLGALFMHRLVDCTVIGGPVAGAMHIEGTERCKIYVAARQVRIHSAQSCDFYLRVRSGPIIEHSSGLRFAPLGSRPLVYNGVEEHLTTQGLDQDGGQWSEVQDFGWLRAAASPHWSVLPETERIVPSVEK